MSQTLDFSPWQCLCSFHNEGLETVCGACGVTREENEARIAAALNIKQQVTTTTQPASSKGSTIVTVSRNLHDVVTAALTSDSMPGWRRSLEQIPLIGPWLNHPAQTLSIFLLKAYAWVFRVLLILQAVVNVILGLVQLVMPGGLGETFGEFASNITGRVVLFIGLVLSGLIHYLIAEVIFHFLNGQAQLIQAIYDGRWAYVERRGEVRFNSLIAASPYRSAKGSNRLLENTIVAIRVLGLLVLFGAVSFSLLIGGGLERELGLGTSAFGIVLLILIGGAVWFLWDLSLKAALLIPVINRFVLGLVESSKIAWDVTYRQSD